MSGHTDSKASDAGTNYLALTFALMGGAAVWLLRLIANSALVRYSCEIGASWPLWATTGVATLVGVAALVYAWRLNRSADGGDAAHGAAWLGWLGVLFNVTAIVGIIFETLPVLVLDVCRSAFPV